MDGKSLTKKTKFDVSRPKATISAGTIGVVTYTNNNRRLSLEGTYATVVGDTKNPPGQFDFVQVIDSVQITETFRGPLNASGIVRPPISFSATNRVDFSSPYPHVTHSGPMDREVSSTFIDVPANFINPSAQDFFLAEYFSDYILFQPECGIHVPVLQIDWNWTGEVSYVNGAGLQLAYSSATASAPSDLSEYPPQFAIFDFIAGMGSGFTRSESDKLRLLLNGQ